MGMAAVDEDEDDEDDAVGEGDDAAGVAVAPPTSAAEEPAGSTGTGGGGPCPTGSSSGETVGEPKLLQQKQAQTMARAKAQNRSSATNVPLPTWICKTSPSSPPWAFAVTGKVSKAAALAPALQAATTAVRPLCPGRGFHALELTRWSSPSLMALSRGTTLVTEPATMDTPLVTMRPLLRWIWRPHASLWHARAHYG